MAEGHRFSASCGINTVLIDMTYVRGIMTASWFEMVPKKYYAQLNDAFVFGNAKKKYFGEE